MTTSNVILGHTLHCKEEELSGSLQNNLLIESDTIFFTVELKLCGKYEIHEFKDLDSAVEQSKQKNIIYRFIEYAGAEESRKILILQNALHSEQILAFQNIYGIGDNWKLFVNSKSDVVVQHMNFPMINTTVRFRYFNTGQDFYLYLACLLYTLTNYEIKNEEDIRIIFKKIENYIIK